MAAFRLTPQQKQIFEQMRTYQEVQPYEKVAKDMGLSPKGTQSQLGKLRDYGLLTEPEEHKFIIAGEAQELLDASGEDTTVTMADVNLTPKQFFGGIGRTWGINPERVGVIANMIWQSGDSEDLDHVWDSLGRAQVSPDIKRLWVSAWQAFISQADPKKLKWAPPTMVEDKVQEVLQKKAVAKEVEKIEEEGPKEWIIDVKKNEPIKVGEGIGLYSLKEAKELMAIRMYSESLRSGSRTDAVAGEKVSELLTALAPFLKGEGKDQTETLALTRELFMEKLTSGLRELELQLPQQGNKGEWYETLPQILTAVASVGPTLKTLLGIPDTKEIAALIDSRLPKGDGTPMQMIKPDGTPVVFNKEMMEFWRFNADQKREEDKHKVTMDMMGGVRDFVGKITTAATRMSGEKKP